MSFSISGFAEAIRTWRGSALVTLASMGLWQFKCFRAYREFSANTVLKFVATKPFKLNLQNLWTGQGAARLVISTGATEAGTFTPITTKFCMNTTAGDVAGATTVSAGGTLSVAGTEREVLRSDSGTGGGGVGNNSQNNGPRLLAAGTYYMSIVVTGTTAGLYALEWEEFD